MSQNRSAEIGVCGGNMTEAVATTRHHGLGLKMVAQGHPHVEGSMQDAVVISTCDPLPVFPLCNRAASMPTAQWIPVPVSPISRAGFERRRGRPVMLGAPPVDRAMEFKSYTRPTGRTCQSPYQPWVEMLQVRVAKAQPFHGARREILPHHIDLRDQNGRGHGPGSVLRLRVMLRY